MKINDIINGKTSNDFESVEQQLIQWFSERGEDGYLSNFLTHEEAKQLGEYVCQCSDKQVQKLWDIFNLSAGKNIYKLHPHIKDKVVEVARRSTGLPPLPNKGKSKNELH